jgi:glycosyltransferase involved in cell wall biosynthesis
MSIYNKDNYLFLERALLSISIEQTLKPNQIVLVKDGFLNEKLNNVIDNFISNTNIDIKVLQLENNNGLACALNQGIKYCKYDIIARMDADDISHSSRFEKQIKFLISNPEYAIIGSNIIEFFENGSKYVKFMPKVIKKISLSTKLKNPLNHPTVIFKKNIIIENGLYPNLAKGQDFALWSILLLNGYSFYNIQDNLLEMRMGKKYNSKRNFSFLKSEIKLLNFQKNIGYLSKIEYIIVLLIKTTFRLQPNYISNFIYKSTRKFND